MCKAVEIGKTEDVLRYHPGIKHLTKKNPVVFLRYFKLCFSWMAHRKNEIVEESYYTLIFCCFFICEIKRNSYQ